MSGIFEIVESPGSSNLKRKTFLEITKDNEEYFAGCLINFENELKQVIVSMNQFGINCYFEELKEIVALYKLERKEYIDWLIVDYNERVKSAFNKRYNIDSEKGGIISFEIDDRYCREFRSTTIPTNIIRIKSHVEGFTLGPATIDLKYSNDYWSFLLSINKTFFSIADKHLELYERGKYIAANSVTLINPQFVYPNDPQDLKNMANRVLNANDKNKKIIKPIIASSTAGQLVFLFEELQKLGLLPSNIDIHASIRDHFCDIDGNPYKNLKQAKQNYLNSKTGKPKMANEIDDIVKRMAY